MQSQEPSAKSEKFTEQEYLKLRSRCAAILAGKDMFYSLALLSACEQHITDVPALAGISNKDGAVSLFVNPKTVTHCLDEEKGEETWAAIMTHEVSHLIQVDTFQSIYKIIDLTPIRDVYVDKMSKSTTPEAKRGWQDLIDLIDNEDSSHSKKIKTQAAQIGMDAPINEAVSKLFPNSMDRIAHAMRKCFDSGKTKEELEKTGPITPVVLSKMFKKKLPNDQEWYFYSWEWILWYAEKLEDSAKPDEPPISYIPMPGSQQDEHGFEDFDEGSTPDEKAEGRRKINEVVEKAKKEAEVLAHKAGRKPADMELFTEITAINKRLETLLNQVVIKFKRIFSPSNCQEYRYERINKLWPDNGLPGYMDIDKPTPKVVMVVDTSGSMCDQFMLNQMVASARKFYKKNQLIAFYCCDTELTQIDLVGLSKNIKLKGGGGTEFSPKQISSILDDMKMKRGLDIIYLTDEYVYGLEESKADKRVKLHVINVPKALEQDV